MREDNVILVQKNDRFVVEFSDGTRITSFYSKAQLEKVPRSIVIENPAFARVEHNQSGKCIVDLPAHVSVECFDGQYKILKPNTIAMTLTSTGELECTMEPTSFAKLSKRYIVSHSLEPTKPLLSGTDGTGSQYSVLCTGEITKQVGANTDGIHFPGASKLCGKVFIVNEDDSCYEVHPNRVLQEAVQKANDEVNALVLNEEVPQCAQCKATTIVMSQCSRSQSTGVDYSEKSIVPLNLKTIPFRELNDTSSRRRFGVAVGKALMIGSYNKPVSTPQDQAKKVLTCRQLVQLPADSFSSIYPIIAKYVQLQDLKEEKDEDLLPLTLQKMGECPSCHCYLHSSIDPNHILSLFEREQGKDVSVNSGDGNAVPNSTKTLSVHKFDEAVPKSKFPVPYFESSEGLDFLHLPSQKVSPPRKDLPRNPRVDTLLKAPMLSTSPKVHSDAVPLKGLNMHKNVNDQHIMPHEFGQITPTNVLPWADKNNSPPPVRPTNPTPHQASCPPKRHLSEFPEVVHYGVKSRMNGEEGNANQKIDSGEPPHCPSSVSAQTGHFCDVTNAKVNCKLCFSSLCMLLVLHIYRRQVY